MLSHTDHHVLLGFVLRENCYSLVALHGVNYLVGEFGVEAEGPANHVLALESAQQCKMPTNTCPSDEQLVSSPGHLVDLSLHDLLNVSEALRLQEVLARSSPVAFQLFVSL